MTRFQEPLLDECIVSASEGEPSMPPTGRTWVTSLALALVLVSVFSWAFSGAAPLNGGSRVYGEPRDSGVGGVRGALAGQDDIISKAIGMVSNDSIAEHLLLLTPVPHIAGSQANLVTAKFVESKLLEYGWAAHHVDYPVLLSYPLSLKLTMTKPTPFHFQLREGSFPEDPYSKTPLATTPFLAYSPNGAVTGEVVYANYGTTEDFEALAQLGVNCSGTVVVVRYGKIFRGNKVTNAEARGASAVIIYSDPADYDPEGTAPESLYPKGPGIPASGVQRGSIFLWKGDPETPGWPSEPGGERLSPKELKRRLPGIPAIPISWGNAAQILGEMGGQVAPQDWQGAVPGLVYHIGPGPSAVFLEVKMNQTRASIRNVVGVIQGYEEPHRYIVLGNHRDAWVYGAADPNSGTASILEVARVLGSLHADSGWVPRCSILVCDWDAEEYGLLGSTEWVEANLGLLQAQAIAYINVDTAVSDASAPFAASSTPQLDHIIRSVAALVQDPNSPKGVTILDAWKQLQNATEPKLGRLGGGGSDFSSFLQHAGVASVDLRFSRGYPMYHSLYDNYYWMTKFGDPGFRRNTALTQLWVALTLRLSGDQVLPFNYSNYVAELEAGVAGIRETLEAAPQLKSVDLAPLSSALSTFSEAARELHSSVPARGANDLPGVLGRQEMNEQLMLAERGFLDEQGVGRGELSWFKHLVYAPQKDNGYGTLPFPALDDAINVALRCKDNEGRKRDGTGACATAVDRVQHEVYRLSRAVKRVSGILKGKIL